jgi:hypothetical protein
MVALTRKAQPHHNFTATTDPTVNDDSADGYSAGSMWMNAGTGWMFRCRSATVGAARWTSIDINDHPGYVAGKYMVPAGWSQFSTAAAGINTMRAGYGVVKERLTISELFARVTGTATAGANFQLALYTVDPATKNPQTLLGNTASLSGAAAAVVSGALSGGNVTLEPGGYWFVFNTDNATPTFMTLNVAQVVYNSLFGSSSLSTALLSSTNFVGKTVAQSFGTWPSDASAMSWADSSGVIPAIGFLVASVP